MLARNAAQLTYEDAAGEGVDVEYTVLPGRVKEAIILESPQNIVSYIMDITAEGLTASINESGEIVFSDGTEVIFTIWAPYMYDSADELSEEIEVDLADNGNGSYTVTLTPDAEWLNDEARVYPITIDPDVSASTDQTNGIDNSVEQGSGVITHTLDRLYAGKRNGKKRRFYQKFKTMPTIPSGATINSATQTFYVTSGTSTGNSLKAYRVDADWSSKTITWANKPAASSTIQSNIGHNGLTRYNIDMKSTVKGWYSGSTTGRNRNYGIMVQYQNETINDFNTVYSADFATAAKRPQLKISYTGGGAVPTPTPITPEPPSNRPALFLDYNKEYYIKNKNSGQYLTVSGTNVNQAKYTGATSQRWKLISTGNGECNIIPMSNQSYALNVSGNSASNDANIVISTNKSATGSKFKVYFNSDLVTYRMASKPSGFNKTVVVSGASCQAGANVIQYSYNRTHNDEWIFEPRTYTMGLAKQYAHTYAEKPNAFPTYPKLDGDCANFASQCMLASGIHFRDAWFIYKKNNDRPEPSDNELELSWEIEKMGGILGHGASSPWISAKHFKNFWEGKVETARYKASYILEHQQEIYNLNFGPGDVVQTLYLDGRTGRHTLYICCYGTSNGKPDYNLSYHTRNRRDVPLSEVAAMSLENGDEWIVFYKMK